MKHRLLWNHLRIRVLAWKRRNSQGILGGEGRSRQGWFQFYPVYPEWRWGRIVLVAGMVTLGIVTLGMVTLGIVTLGIVTGGAGVGISTLPQFLNPVYGLERGFSQTLSRELSGKWHQGGADQNVATRQSRRVSPAPSPNPHREVSTKTLNVLLISSWSPRLPWLQVLIQSLTQPASAPFDVRVNLYGEFLDYSRLNKAVDFDAWMTWMETKYATVPLDALILDAGPAIDWVRSHPTSRFRALPAVLLPNANLRPDQITDFQSSAVVNLGPIIPETLRLALAQNPDAESLVVIGDRTPDAQDLIAAIRQQLAQLDRHILLDVWDQFTLPELLAKVQDLPKSTVILFTLVFSDTTGQQMRPADVVAAIAPPASVPVYVLYDSMLGTGAIGGHVQSAQQTGQIALQAAYKAHQRQLGGDTSNREYQASQTMVDWQALQRWRLDSAMIPDSATWINQPPPLWKTYGREVSVALILIGLQGISLLALGRMFIQKRTLTQQLQKLTARLEVRVAERTRELQRLAITDDLTGLGNRKAFYQQANTILQQFHDTGQGFSLAILDLDYFKAINDTYGHLAGDTVLQAFAQIMRQEQRAGDILGRIGGEEFAILLPNAPHPAAFSAAERLRQRVAATKIPLTEHYQVSITVSIGLASSHDQDDAIESIVQRADHALYAAKQAGRNCVVVAVDPPDDSVEQ